MTPRLRVSLLVVGAALLAAGITVGATVLTATHPHRAAALRPGAPPLLLDLGVRTDPEAVALRRASALYAGGKRAQARAIFARYPSLEAQVGAALAGWPAGRADVERLARAHPRSAVVELHLGFVRFWEGANALANAAWRTAKRLDPDSQYAIRAGDLLHPGLPIPGLPPFVPSFPSPPALARLSPPKQLAFLAARARAGGVRAKLLYGSALQRLGRPVSAERAFVAAARLAPRDIEARTAAAVGLFDKDRPALAFSRLGPLSRSHPRAVTVRFHLGLLLLWLGQVRQAKVELADAVADGAGTTLAREAEAFLKRLAAVGTSPQKR